MTDERKVRMTRDPMTADPATAREWRYEETERGFARWVGRDRYDMPCSLQKSSIATEDCVWFGVDDAQPKVLASEAATVGVHTAETTGWVPYPVPSAVLLSTRMHITRDQMRELLPLLEHFVKTGDLPTPEVPNA